MNITSLLAKPFQVASFGLSKAASAAMYCTGGSNLINMGKYLSPLTTEVQNTSFKTATQELRIEKKITLDKTITLTEDLAAAASELPFLAAKVAVIGTIVASQLPAHFEERTGVQFPTVLGTQINQTLTQSQDFGNQVVTTIAQNLPSQETVVAFAKAKATAGLEMVQNNPVNSVLIGVATLATLSAFHDFHKMNSTTEKTEMTYAHTKVTTITQKSGYEKLSLAVSGVLKLGVVAAGIAVKASGILDECTDLEKTWNFALQYAPKI